MQCVVEPSDDAIASHIVQSKNVLKGEADMREIFLDIGALLIFMQQGALALQEMRQPPRALLQAQFDLPDKLWIRFDGLLGLRRVGNPDRRDMNEDRYRGDGQAALRLMQAIGAPIDLQD